MMNATGYPSSRHPFEVFLLLICILSGIPTLLGGPRPGSIDETLPEISVRLWAALLVGGAFVALAGIMFKRRVLGLVLEQIGLVAAGTACLVYAATILLVVGSPGLLSGGAMLAFGGSCLWRWVQLQRVLNDARRTADGRDR